MQTTQKSIILLLVLAVLVLGFLIYKKKTSSPLVETSPTTSPSFVKLTPAQVSLQLKDIQDLIAANPWPDKEKMKRYSERIDNESLPADVLDITNCVPKPSVMRVKFGQALNIVNNDDVFHKINNSDLVIEMAAKSTKNTNPGFPTGGIYTYRCDEQLAGIFWVIP